MRLTQILLRKRKMNTKPQSFTRNWQWNTAWYIGQERKVKNIGMKQALAQRGIPVYLPEEVISPAHPEDPREPLEPETETQLKPLPKDESHPLWQDKEAYSYKDNSWLPKDLQVEFALAATNSLPVDNLPQRVMQRKEKTEVGLTTELRLETLVNSAFIGDAVQKVLPRNWKVPYIGWHPVESMMRPRNIYDHTKFSWGRRQPTEYGIPNARKIGNLVRNMFTEMVKSQPEATSSLQFSCEREVHRQFLEAPSGHLIRYYLTVPLTIKSSSPLEPVASQQEIEDTKNRPIVSVEPQSPLASLHPTNIYRHENNHPITSLSHSHPFIHTVFDLQTSHIGDPFTDPYTWISPAQKGRCLMLGFAVAMGQARLRFGPKAIGVLPKPVTVNVVSTNGVKWELTTVQVNSLDLGSEVKNLFYQHPEPLTLMDFCGYREARPTLEGLNKETFATLSALLTTS